MAENTKFDYALLGDVLFPYVFKQATTDLSVTHRDQSLTAISQATAEEVQVAGPIADVTDGNWLNESGSATNLYASLDETTPSETDYITTTDLLLTNVVEVMLASLTDPQASDYHTLEYKINHDSGLFIELEAALVQGTTVIAEWLHPYVEPGPSTLSHTITASEADSITDYSDLRLRLAAAERAEGFTYDQYRSVSSGIESTTTSAVANAAAGAQQGDLLVAVVYSSLNTLVTAVPSGWTLVDEAQSASGQPGWLRMYWKIAGSSEPSTYTWTLDTAVETLAAVVCYSNAPNASVDVTGEHTAANLTTITAPSITTTGRDRLLVWAAGWPGARTISSDPSEMRRRLSYAPVPHFVIFDEFREPTGATGTRSLTVTSSANPVGVIAAFKLQ